jgi:signal peptide peptidase SppA
MNRYAHVVQFITAHPWAILPETLRAITDVVALRVAGGQLADAEIEDRLAAARQRQGARGGATRTGVTAVIPVYGVIMPKATLFAEMSGASSVEGIRGAFREALADPDVGRIVFDVDSPGGSVEGVLELAEEIRAARGQKPMTAVANYLRASAAYWIAAQADEVVASPSSLVGSIGVYAVHEDWSEAYAQQGVRPTVLKAGKYKAEGLDIAPLSAEATEHFQEGVDDAYADFVGAVAAGRGDTAANVRNGYGEGRALTAKRAKAAGLVDRVDTLEGAFARTPKMRTAEEPAPALVAAAAELAAVEGDAFAFEAERRRRYGLRPA